MNYKFFLFLILTIILGGLWGYSQIIIFPFKEYGLLALLTTLIGGFFIGYTIGKIYSYCYE